jgi:aspartyl-tRNA(Asn)/glutamyl-tRNA(Gln) amidotransferase subunit B
MKVKIGLETHVQLNTKTKMFCGCSMKGINEAEPNSRCCPTCLGMPGSKPRVNKAAIDAGIKIALALDCKIKPEIFFSRKTYLYPDMSKNFQITQYEIPLATGGSLDTIDSKGKTKKIRLERINLEEDPAKLQHIGGNITTASYVLIDYNRSGVPLAEIVTKPDFSSPKEARLFLQRLLAVLEYLKVFKTGKFSLKSDANISIEGGERIEVKNVTGFKEIEDALLYEIVRQKDVLKKGGKITRETRAWDEKAKITRSLRKKEFEEDYGYIFEPDLTKIEITDKRIEDIRKALPELPHQKYERYLEEFKISPELAASIITDLDLAQLYEKIVKKIEPKFAATWMNILKKTLFYNDLVLKETKLTPSMFIKLLDLIQNNKITDRGGEMILREIIFKPEEFNVLVEKYSKIKAESIEEIVDSILEKEKKAVKEVKQGNKKALEFLIGQIIRKTDKRLDGKTARSILEKKIKDYNC